MFSYGSSLKSLLGTAVQSAPARGKTVKLIRARAPLRLGLAGGGTDVSPYCDGYGGAVLNGTIGVYAYAAIEPLVDPIVSFQSFDRNEQVEYESTSELPMDGKLDLLKAIHNYAVKNFN